MNGEEFNEYEQIIINKIKKFNLNNINDVKSFLYIIYANNDLDIPDQNITKVIQEKIFTLILQEQEKKENTFYNKEKLETKLTKILPQRIYDRKVFNNGEFR